MTTCLHDHFGTLANNITLLPQMCNAGDRPRLQRQRDNGLVGFSGGGNFGISVQIDPVILGPSRQRKQRAAGCLRRRIVKCIDRLVTGRKAVSVNARNPCGNHRLGLQRAKSICVVLQHLPLVLSITPFPIKGTGRVEKSPFGVLFADLVVKDLMTWKEESIDINPHKTLPVRGHTTGEALLGQVVQ